MDKNFNTSHSVSVDMTLHLCSEICIIELYTKFPMHRGGKGGSHLPPQPPSGFPPLSSMDSEASEIMNANASRQGFLTNSTACVRAKEDFTKGCECKHAVFLLSCFSVLHGTGK